VRVQPAGAAVELEKVVKVHGAVHAVVIRKRIS